MLRVCALSCSLREGPPYDSVCFLETEKRAQLALGPVKRLQR